MEGAEESASVDLNKYLVKYKEQLSQAELLVWEQGILNKKNQLEISGGNKGIVTFDVSVTVSDWIFIPHLVGLLISVRWYLLQALNSLREPDGTIKVPGNYDKVQEPNERELALVEEYALIHAEGLHEIYGLTLPLSIEEKSKNS